MLCLCTIGPKSAAQAASEHKQGIRKHAFAPASHVSAGPALGCWRDFCSTRQAAEKPYAMPAASHPQARLSPVKPVALLDIFSSYVDLLTLCVVLSSFWSVGFLWIWGRILFEGLMDDDSQETAGRKP